MSRNGVANTSPNYPREILLSKIEHQDMDGKLNVAVGQCPAELVGPQARYDWLKKTLDNIDGQRLDLLILPELFLTGYNVGERLIEWGEAQEGPFAGRIAKLADKTVLLFIMVLPKKTEANFITPHCALTAMGNVSANTKNYCSRPDLKTDISFPEAGARCLAWAALTLQL